MAFPKMAVLDVPVAVGELAVVGVGVAVAGAEDRLPVVVALPLRGGVTALGAFWVPPISPMAVLALRVVVAVHGEGLERVDVVVGGWPGWHSCPPMALLDLRVEVVVLDVGG